MGVEQATQIIGFLEKYNEHFAEVVKFLNLKMQKVLADDLVWLHDSLQEEQKFSMAGNSLENKRLELLSRLGFSDYSSTKLLELMPNDYKGKFKLECIGIESSIDKIRTLNGEILETIEKKLEVAEEHLKQQGIAGPSFYGAAGSKLRITDPEGDIIGKM
ncbi:MAG: hypothetical protein FWH07_04540 [Oscillospiraceae bacterium]|nr:hypothetical protein [Oscillospiraceae bacterium]